MQIIKSVLLFVLFFLLPSTSFAANPSSYKTVSLENLSLNRPATNVSSSLRSKFPHSHTGFVWREDDNNTNKWRPQGIAGIVKGNRKFLAVTWYGREEANYQDLSLIHI